MSLVERMMDSLDTSLTPAFGGQPATPRKGGLEVTKKQGRGTGPNAVCMPQKARESRIERWIVFRPRTHRTSSLPDSYSLREFCCQALPQVWHSRELRRRTQKLALKAGSPAGILLPGPSISEAYLAFSTISTRRQRLSADSGRVSAITTKSPMPAWLFSS